MKFDFEDKTILIKFHHTIYLPKNIETQCTIEFRRDDQCESHFGVAHKSEKDNFCREIGRKIALLRAVKNAGLDRQQKQAFFKKYWEEREKETNGKRRF